MNWTTRVHLSYYFLDASMPQRTAAHIEELKANNPTFEVTVWGPHESRALIASTYPDFLKKYDTYPHAIQRSDFSRYAILHAMGGVYMDMDYTLNAPLLDIFAFLDGQFPEEAVFVNETPNGVFLRRLSNSFMISRKPQHPFWMHVMHATSNGNGVSAHQRILSSTGPQAVDRAYKSYKNKRGVVGVLPKKYFNPCGICARGTACQRKEHVLAFHENDGGWNTQTSRIYNSLSCNLWWWVFFLVFLIVVITLISVLAGSGRRCRQQMSCMV